MAVLTHDTNPACGGQLSLAVGDGSTGGDLTVESVDGRQVTVFAGGPTLLAIAGLWAAPAATADDCSAQDQLIWSGIPQYGDTPQGEMTLTTTTADDEPSPDSPDSPVTVNLRARAGGQAEVTVTRDELAAFGQACGAAGYDL